MVLSGVAPTMPLKVFRIYSTPFQRLFLPEVSLEVSVGAFADISHQALSVISFRGFPWMLWFQDSDISSGLCSEFFPGSLPGIDPGF